MTVMTHRVLCAPICGDCSDSDPIVGAHDRLVVITFDCRYCTVKAVPISDDFGIFKLDRSCPACMQHLRHLNSEFDLSCSNCLQAAHLSLEVL